MIRLGITGGIGSGKSVVSELLKMNAIPVYNADIESKRLINDSAFIKEKLILLFGPDIYLNGTINKALLASYIFSDKHLLKEVNAIVHPETLKDFERWTQRQGQLCGIESAILFESGFNRFVDRTIMVYAPENIRIKRAVVRDRSNRDAIVNRIKSQMQDEEKATLCNYIIYNDDQRALIPQIHFLLRNLKT